MRISNWKRIYRIAALTVVITTGAIFWANSIYDSFYGANTPAPQVPYQAPHPPVDVQLPPPPPVNLAASQEFNSKLEKATVRLYANVAGDVTFFCTATAIEKNATGYVFLTARHCVTGTTGVRGWFVVVDPKSDTPYIKATVLIAGAPDTDAAILQVNTALDIPTVPLGDEKKTRLGGVVEYFGFPQDIEKLYFQGYVSALKVGPPHYDSPQWNGDLGVTIQIAPGSSGSALVDPNQQAIIGVVTGATISRFGGVILSMVTPATKVRTLVDDYKTGRIKKPVKVGLFK